MPARARSGMPLASLGTDGRGRDTDPEEGAWRVVRGAFLPLAAVWFDGTGEF